MKKVRRDSVVYTDESPAVRTVRVTQKWKESGNVQSPPAPAAPESPAVGAEVHATYVPFSWPAVEGCDAYALRVSRDPEFKYPYRPNYDVVLTENKYEVPFAGMFSPGETYYWRVRRAWRMGCGVPGAKPGPSRGAGRRCRKISRWTRRAKIRLR